MSENKEQEGRGLCRWCDTITNSIVKEYEKGRLTWVGCIDCHRKKKELEKKHEQIVKD